MKHYELGGSTAKRWINCTGSVEKARVAEEARQPRSTPVGGGGRDTSAATRGSFLHTELEKALTNDEYKVDLPDDPEGAQMVRDCREYINGIPGTSFMAWIEATFEGAIDLGGTADYVALQAIEDERFLIVVDFKTGRIPVTAKENHQLLFYATLVVDHIEEAVKNLKSDWFDKVRLVIFQPSNGGADEWELPREDLTFFKETRDAAAAAIRGGETALNPGSWCQYCPARDGCEAFLERAQQLAREDFLATPNEKLVKLLEIRPALQALLDSIPSRVLEEMKKGHEFEGWKAIQSFGHRRWCVNDFEVISALGFLGVEPTKEVIKSPPEILREYPGVDLEGLIERPDRGIKVVPENHNGEPVDFLSSIGDE